MPPSHSVTLLVSEPDLAVQAHRCTTFVSGGHQSIPALSSAEKLPTRTSRRSDRLLSAGDSALSAGDRGMLARPHAAVGTVPVGILSAAGGSPFVGYRACGCSGLVARPGNSDDPKHRARAAARARWGPPRRTVARLTIANEPHRAVAMTLTRDYRYRLAVPGGHPACQLRIFAQDADVVCLATAQHDGAGGLSARSRRPIDRATVATLLGYPCGA